MDGVVMWNSKKYRMVITELPCARCGREGRSQAAHMNYGKGMGLKSSDATCFPLCADQPGAIGCHTEYDQGRTMSRDEKRTLAVQWLADTHIALIERGFLKVA